MYPYEVPCVMKRNKQSSLTTLFQLLGTVKVNTLDFPLDMIVVSHRVEIIPNFISLLDICEPLRVKEQIVESLKTGEIKVSMMESTDGGHSEANRVQRCFARWCAIAHFE